MLKSVERVKPFVLRLEFVLANIVNMISVQSAMNTEGTIKKRDQVNHR